jgi:hypothetical protein
MLTVEQILTRIGPMNKRAVARASGISYGAIRNLLAENPDPKHITIVKLSDYLESLQ